MNPLILACLITGCVFTYLSVWIHTFQEGLAQGMRENTSTYLILGMMITTTGLILWVADIMLNFVEAMTV